MLQGFDFRVQGTGRSQDWECALRTYHALFLSLWGSSVYVGGAFMPGRHGYKPVLDSFNVGSFCQQVVLCSCRTASQTRSWTKKKCTYIYIYIHIDIHIYIHIMVKHPKRLKIDNLGPHLDCLKELKLSYHDLIYCLNSLKGVI